MKILCDVDSTLVDTLPGWLKLIGDRTGVLAQVKDITQWDMHKCPPLNMLRANGERLVQPSQIYDILEEPGFLSSLPPINGGPEAIEDLMDSDHTVLFPTARRGLVSMQETLKWFAKYMPFVNVGKQVIFIGDKHHLKADVLVEDRGENLLKYAQHHREALLTGILYPYNAFALQESWSYKIGLKYPMKLFEPSKDVWDQIFHHVQGHARERARVDKESS